MRNLRNVRGQPVNSFECVSAKVNYSAGRQCHYANDTFTNAFSIDRNPYTHTHTHTCSVKP